MTDEMLGAVHRVSLHVPASPGVLNRCVCVPAPPLLPPESFYRTYLARRSAEVLGTPRGDALGSEHHWPVNTGGSRGDRLGQLRQEDERRGAARFLAQRLVQWWTASVRDAGSRD